MAPPLQKKGKSSMKKLIAAFYFLFVLFPLSVNAQGIPVYDATSFAQFAQQLQEQAKEYQKQLEQLEAMTGARNAGALSNGVFEQQLNVIIHVCTPQFYIILCHTHDECTVCDLGPCRRFDAESRYAVCVHPKCYRVTLCNPNIEGAVIGRPCGCERAKADEPDIRDGHQIETDGQRQENRCQNASYYCFANKSVAFEVNDNGRHASAWIAPAIDEGITPVKPKRVFG